MGTRGFIGFVAEGTEKIAYNHWDSYPSGLGLDVLRWLRDVTVSLDDLRTAVIDLRVVTQAEKPTDADVERLARWTDRGVGNREDWPSWYQLLRHSQGNPSQMLAAGAIEDASEFPADSLFAEWGYVVDLDAQVFEAYRGFQREAHDKGRFAVRGVKPRSSGLSDTYYPVALVASWPLKELPTDDAFMGVLEPHDDED